MQLGCATSALRAKSARMLSKDALLTTAAVWQGTGRRPTLTPTPKPSRGSRTQRSASSRGRSLVRLGG